MGFYDHSRFAETTTHMHTQVTTDPVALWGISSLIFSLFLLSHSLEASADIPPPRELFTKQLFTASPVPLERLTPQLVKQMRVRTRPYREKMRSYFSKRDPVKGVENIQEEHEQKHLLVQDLRVTLTLYPLWATMGVETQVNHIDHNPPSDHHDLALHIRDESPPLDSSITLSDLLLSYHAQWDQSPLQVIPHTYTTRDEERPLYLSFFRVRAPFQQGNHHYLKYTFTTLYPHEFSKESLIKEVFFGHRQLNVNDQKEPVYTSVDLKIVGENAQLSLSDHPRWAGQEVYPILPPLLDWSSIQTWTELLSASGLDSKPVEEISNALRFSLITLSLLDLAYREESDPTRWWHALRLLNELAHSNTDVFGEHARSLMSTILSQELRLEKRDQASDEWASELLSQRSQVSTLSELLRNHDPDELEAQFAPLIHKVQQDKDRAHGTPSDEHEIQVWRELFGDQTQNLDSLSFEKSLSQRTLHLLSKDPRLCSGGCTQALEWLNSRNRRIEYAYRLIWSSFGFICLIGLVVLRWRKALPL